MSSHESHMDRTVAESEFWGLGSIFPRCKEVQDQRRHFFKLEALPRF